MLNTLRKGTGSLLVKAFLGLLVLSFVTWGVADVFRGYGARTLATVGSQTISPDQFQAAYDNELQRIQMQFGQRLTREQARAFGIESQVLTRMIRDAVMDEHAREMNLGLSDQGLLASIERDPAFKGTDGTFSRLTFEQTLRANNLREGSYLARQRTAEVRSQISEALLSEVPAPTAAAQALNRYREEARTLAFISVPEAKAGAVPAPDEAKLKAYYDANLPKFSWPEYRKLAWLAVTPDALKKPDAISEDELKAAFEERKAAFGTPEKRTLQQIPFADMAAAEKANGELKAGKAFMAVASELGLKEADVNLGPQTRASMVDKTVAEAAFALPKGEISRPVQGSFATVIVRATEITPAVVKTFEQVKAELRDTLAREKAAEEVQALTDKVENARGRGASLKEIGEKNGLAVNEIGAVERSGNGPDGKPVAGLPDAQKVLAKAFEPKELGTDIEPVDLTGGGSVWIDLQAITPQKAKPFEEVKDAVALAYTSAEQRKALAELARKLTDRLAKGETMEALAGELGLRVETSQPLKRTDKSEQLTAALISQAFAVPKGAAASAETSDGRARIVFKVTDVIQPPAPDKAKSDQLAKELGQQMTADLATQYLGALQSRYGVKINNDVLNRVTGRAEQ